MKVFCSGVKRGHGIGKESKNAYDMVNMLTLVPVKPGKQGGMTVEGYGFEQMELKIESASFVAACASIKFPCVLDLELGVTPEFGEYKTTILGFAEPEKKAA